MHDSRRNGLGPVWLLTLAAGASFGLGPAWGQDLGGGGMFPEDVPVYDESYEYDASGEGEDGAAHDAVEPSDSGVSVSEYMTVDIFVQDEDLANVLQMLSLQSQRNIVASRDVSATVTANLYGVTFYEALDAILHVNGYAWYEEGNFIHVVPIEVAQARAEAQREVVGKVVSLNYLNGTDAAEFVTPLLSEVGQIKANGDSGEYSLPDDAPAGGESFALSATLVIYDYPEHVEEIEALLRQLDTRPAQVLVEATILQTQLTEANAFGVDFAILADVEFLDFFNAGGPLGSAAALAGLGNNEVAPLDGRATSIVGTPGDFAGPGTIKAGIIHDDIAIFLRALDEVSDTTILSNPKVMALNRQPARVLVGRKLGFLNTTSTETATTQTVEFLDTGTQLSFRPFVAQDGNIRMELKPRVSEGVIREATDVTGAAVTIPDEVTQELTTNVIVPDGSTIVLGGLFKEQTRLSRSQVPVLGDIPLVGAAFRGHEDDTDRSEVIFMIKPTIVNDSIMEDQGDLAMDYVDNVRTGSRKGLLPFSRDRQTMQHNLKAERLVSEGELDRAAWELRRSLELNPSQPAVIRMLEDITGEDRTIPTRSVLERVIRGEVEKSYGQFGEGTLFDGEPIGAFDRYAEPLGEGYDREYVPRSTELAEGDVVSTDEELMDADARGFDPFAWFPNDFGPEPEGGAVASSDAGPSAGSGEAPGSASSFGRPVETVQQADRSWRKALKGGPGFDGKVEAGFGLNGNAEAVAGVGAERGGGSGVSPDAGSFFAGWMLRGGFAVPTQAIVNGSPVAPLWVIGGAQPVEGGSDALTNVETDPEGN